MRAQQTASFDKTCLLRTPGSATSDSAGGFTEAAASDASLACRVAPPTGTERAIAERLGREVDTVVTFPHGTSVANTQSVVVGGRTYEVVHVNDDESYQTAVRVMARRLS
jgi:SPP1 family predicted phage head-tail adaptor